MHTEFLTNSTGAARAKKKINLKQCLVWLLSVSDPNHARNTLASTYFSNLAVCSQVITVCIFKK